MKLFFKVVSSVIPLTILEKSFSEWNSFHSKLEDLKVLLEMAIDANDEETFKEVKSEIKIVQKKPQCHPPNLYLYYISRQSFHLC